MNIFRVLRVLSLIIWLGGIIFFSFVVAPSIFGVLTPVTGGRHLAGDIVNQILSKLQWIGIFCGAMLLIASAVLHQTFRRAEIYLVLTMLLLNGLLLFGIAPRMARIRAGAPDMESAPPGIRAEFAYLHKVFVSAEGGILLLGLGVVWKVAGTRSNRSYRA